MKTTILELNTRIEQAKERYAKLEKLTERVYWTDLKLHEAVDVFKNSEDFYRFCETNYEYCWLPELEDKGVTTIHLGNTSKFIIASDNFKQTMYNYNGLQSDLLSEIFQDSYYITDLENLNTVQFLQDFNNFSIDDFELELGQIEDNMNDLEKGIKEVSQVYRWLEDFKKNQVKYALEECFGLAEDSKESLVDYIDIEWLPKWYPKQYEEFLKEYNLTHTQVVNEPQVTQLNEELDDTRNELKELEEKLKQDTILVAHDLIKGATPYEGVRKLTQLVNIFQQKHSELIVLENELMSQLLELKGE